MHRTLRYILRKLIWTLPILLGITFLAFGLGLIARGDPATTRASTDPNYIPTDEEIQALANRYMNINCACFTPNTGRIDDILRLAKEYKVDGIIDINLKFCNLYDTEGYLVEKAMNEAGIPVLGIETDYTDSDAQQLRTRISAFIEMLNN